MGPRGSPAHFQSWGGSVTHLSEPRDDIAALCGPTRMIVASRKRQSIGDRVLQNKTICDVPPNSGCAPACSQKCRSKRCKCCILMAERGEVLHINGQNLSIPVDFDCTTFNVIYIA